MSDALRRLRDVIADYGSVVVAFSGGVDSALVAAAAHLELGDRAVALTAESPTLPAEEAAIAREVADRIGLQHRIVGSSELESEGYARNAGDRCYFCKSEVFTLAHDVREELGFDVVADGTILDDLGDHRPGLKAAAEHAVRHPLVEAGLDKPRVREAARELGLPVWDKPSFACLGSRFPVGTRVTASKVRKVAAAETALRELGFRQFRVRWHEVGDDILARIELDPSDIPRLAEPGAREAITTTCKEAGFEWVTLDLVGYRTPTSKQTTDRPRRAG